MNMTNPTDRRSLRTRRALRDALAEEILATGDLSQVTVTNVAKRADVTRRTFYSHYRDIPEFVSSIECEVLSELIPHARRISEVTLDELEAAIHVFAPCPYSEELFAYIRENGEIFSALLGEGGDPAFVEKLRRMVRAAVEERALDGFEAGMMAGFDYYLTFVISAEVGVLVRWLTTGMRESDGMMARIMTALLFVRPGDLYGRPIDFDVASLHGEAMERGKELIHG
jgi:AcrR family transcriptional regulator